MATTEASAAGTVASTLFGTYLLRLVGEPFLFLRRSYGDELVLHFGERIVGPARRTKHGEFRYEHGTYSLHLRGSAWFLKGGAVPNVFASGPRPDIEAELGSPLRAADVVDDAPIAAGARVTELIPFPYDRPPVHGIGLRVDLSDGSSLVVVPTPDEPPELAPDGTALPELADWELRTPHGGLQVGPGRKWHFAPAERSQPAPST